jgi:hypothetical protein
MFFVERQWIPNTFGKYASWENIAGSFPKIYEPPQNSMRQKADMKIHTDNPLVLGTTVKKILSPRLHGARNLCTSDLNGMDIRR